MEENTTTGIVRPTFLTVLCILTFIGSGWGVIGAMINYSTSETAGKALEMVDEQMDEAMDEIDDNDEMSEKQKSFMESIFNGITDTVTPENIRKMAIVSVLSSLFTLFGALFMWSLNKNGYYLYIAGIAILIGGTMFVYGGLVGAMAAGASGFFGVLFIVLYGLNLKHMH
jgi:hypothetical protein